MNLYPFEELVDALNHDYRLLVSGKNGLHNEYVYSEESAWEYLWAQITECCTLDFKAVMEALSVSQRPSGSISSQRSWPEKVVLLSSRREVASTSTSTYKFSLYEVLELHRAGMLEGITDYWKEHMVAFMNDMFKSYPLLHGGLRGLQLYDDYLCVFLDSPRTLSSYRMYSYLESIAGEEFTDVDEYYEVLYQRSAHMGYLENFVVPLQSWCLKLVCEALSAVDLSGFMQAWFRGEKVDTDVCLSVSLDVVSEAALTALVAHLEVLDSTEHSLWVSVLELLDSDFGQVVMPVGKKDKVLRECARVVSERVRDMVDGVIRGAVGSVSGVGTIGTIGTIATTSLDKKISHPNSTTLPLFSILCPSFLLADLWLTAEAFPSATVCVREAIARWFDAVVGNWSISLRFLLIWVRDLFTMAPLFDKDGRFTRDALRLLRARASKYPTHRRVLARCMYDGGSVGKSSDEHNPPGILFMQYPSVFDLFNTVKQGEMSTPSHIHLQVSRQYKDLEVQLYTYIEYLVNTTSTITSTTTSSQLLASFLHVENNFPGSAHNGVHNGVNNDIHNGIHNGIHPRQPNSHVGAFLKYAIDANDVLQLQPDDEKVCVVRYSLYYVPEHRGALIGGTHGNPSSSTMLSQMQTHRGKLTLIEPTARAQQMPVLIKAHAYREDLEVSEATFLLQSPVLFFTYIAQSSVEYAEEVCSMLARRALGRVLVQPEPMQSQILRRLNDCAAQLGESLFACARVVLADVEHSRETQQRVAARAQSDQMAIDNFRQFETQFEPGLSGAGSAKQSTKQTKSVPNISLASTPALVDVLHVSHTMWPSNWQSWLLGLRLEVVSTSINQLLSEAAGIGATNGSTPGDTNTTPSVDDMNPSTDSEIGKKQQYTASLYPFQSTAKNELSTHTYYHTTEKPSKLQVYSNCTLRLPRSIHTALDEYTQIYNSMYSPRTLTYMLTEGSVSLDIELAGVSTTYVVNPVCASVITCFGDEHGVNMPQLSAKQVAEITGVPLQNTKEAIRFWLANGVLKYIGNSLYQSVA